MIINRVLIQYIEVYLHIFRIGFPCPSNHKKQTLRATEKKIIKETISHWSSATSRGYKSSVVQIVSRSVKTEDKYIYIYIYKNISTAAAAISSSALKLYF